VAGTARGLACLPYCSPLQDILHLPWRGLAVGLFEIDGLRNEGGMINGQDIIWNVCCVSAEEQGDPCSMSLDDHVQMSCVY
jgi:hypothetical protein